LGRSHSSGEWAVTPEAKRLHTMARDSLARSKLVAEEKVISR
jgi:hypothetical protein